MDKRAFFIVLTAAVAVVFSSVNAAAQTGPDNGHGGNGRYISHVDCCTSPGCNYRMVGSMMGGMGRGHGPGMGMMGSITPYVPAELPEPKDPEWIRQLRDALSLERLSYNQYAADADKYDAHMPYAMVIPQEEDHVRTISALFAAYGIPEDGRSVPITDTESVTEAYRLCIRMEQELIPLYERLVKNAQDPDSAEILNAILLQTRHHLFMFERALSFGGRAG